MDCLLCALKFSYVQHDTIFPEQSKKVYDSPPVFAEIFMVAPHEGVDAFSFPFHVGDNLVKPPIIACQESLGSNPVSISPPGRDKCSVLAIHRANENRVEAIPRVSHRFPSVGG